MNFSQRSHAVAVDEPDLRADSVWIRGWPPQPHAKSRLRAAIVKEARRGAVLRHDEIEPAVRIVVRGRRAALIAVDSETGLSSRDRRQSSLAVPGEKQAATRIVPRSSDRGRKEVLAEEDVLEAVAV